MFICTCKNRIFSPRYSDPLESGKKKKVNHNAPIPIQEIVEVLPIIRAELMSIFDFHGKMMAITINGDLFSLNEKEMKLVAKMAGICQIISPLLSLKFLKSFIEEDVPEEAVNQCLVCSDIEGNVTMRFLSPRFTSQPVLICSLNEEVSFMLAHNDVINVFGLSGAVCQIKMIGNELAKTMMYFGHPIQKGVLFGRDLIVTDDKGWVYSLSSLTNSQFQLQFSSEMTLLSESSDSRAFVFRNDIGSLHTLQSRGIDESQRLLIPSMKGYLEKQIQKELSTIDFDSSRLQTLGVQSNRLNTSIINARRIFGVDTKKITCKFESFLCDPTFTLLQIKIGQIQLKDWTSKSLSSHLVSIVMNHSDDTLLNRKTSDHVIIPMSSFTRMDDIM